MLVTKLFSHHHITYLYFIHTVIHFAYVMFTENAHLLDILPAISFRKVGDFFLSGEWYPGKNDPLWRRFIYNFGVHVDGDWTSANGKKWHCVTLSVCQNVKKKLLVTLSGNEFDFRSTLYTVVVARMLFRKVAWFCSSSSPKGATSFLTEDRTSITKSGLACVYCVYYV